MPSNFNDSACKCTVDRFTKTFFWNYQKKRAVLCYILIDKQMFGHGQKTEALTFAILSPFQDLSRFTHFLEDFGQKKVFF